MSAARTPPEISFTAYTNYIKAIELFMASEYGTADRLLPKLSGVIDQRPAVRRIQRSAHPTPEVLENAINNAWQTELALNYPHLLRNNRLSALSIQWGTIQLYYAIYSAASAWLAAMQGPTAPRSNRSLQKTLGDYATKAMFPLPWGAACHSCTPISYCGEIADYKPRQIRVLGTPLENDALDFLCLALKTTRKEQLETQITKWKNKRKRQHIPQREKARLDDFPPTTVFDFLWRLRVRANYGDPEFFRLGTQYEGDAVWFHRRLCAIGAASLLLFEKLLVAAYGKQKLERLAERFLGQLGEAQSTLGKRMPLW